MMVEKKSKPAKKRNRKHPKSQKIRLLLKNGVLTRKEIAVSVGCSTGLVTKISKDTGLKAKKERDQKHEKEREMARKIIEKNKQPQIQALNEDATIEEIDARLAEITRKEIEILTLLKEDHDTHKIEFFRPLPHQEKFLDYIREGKRMVLLVGGNQIGKCITYQTLISTTKGEIPVGELFDKGNPFEVYSWDGNKKVIARASAPFKKNGLHKCYRITMSDGRWVEPADYHRILDSSGLWRTVEYLSKCFLSRRESISGTSPSIHDASDRRLSEKPLNFFLGYQLKSHLYDVLSHFYQEIFQAFSPLQAGALKHTSPLSRKDDLVNKYTNISQQVFSLLSIQDVLPHFWGRFVETLYRIYGNILLPFLGEYRLSPIPSIAVAPGFLQNYAIGQFVPLKTHAFSPYYPPLTDGNKIVSITPISSRQEVYDFEVEKYHNYFAGGLIHHNTVIDVNTAGSFSLGCKQPWDGQELWPSRFARENGGKGIEGRILCTDWEKSAKETIVPKLKEWLPVGTYETKKNNVGVESDWYFPKTKSHFSILTYKEDTKSHEGWTGDWVEYDEPPPRDKFIANSRGLIARGGISLFAMTAISEPWILDEIVLNPDRTTGIVADIPIQANTTLSEEDIRIYESRLTEDEKVARIKGGWLQLTGRIWKVFNPEIHVVDPFPNGIPADWPCEAQIDFHLNIPHAVSFYACDPYNRFFVFDEIWKNMSTEEIADGIVKVKKSGTLRMRKAFIDPLSKGDTSYVHNRFGRVEDSYSIISKILQKSGITLDVGSKDEKSYIRAVESRLKGVNGPNPTLFIFNTCRETIRQVQRWSYDDNGTPSSEGHFPECIGRATQTGLKYSDPYLHNKPIVYEQRQQAIA
jgi:hypothetical protein